MKDSRLNPHTANAGFRWTPVGDYPDGDYNIAREYYWYDPQAVEPPVADADFRSQHKEIEDGVWRALFKAALDRGERAFLEDRKRDFKPPYRDS